MHFSKKRVHPFPLFERPGAQKLQILTMIPQDLGDHIELQASSPASTSAVIPIEYVDSNKIHRPSVTDFATQQTVLEGDPIVIYIDADKHERFYSKCSRKCLCCLKVDKSTTTFLKTELPKKPICAYVILQHIGKYDSFDRFSRFWMQCAIFLPVLIQLLCSTLFYTIPLKIVYNPEVPMPWSNVNILSMVLLVLFFCKETKVNATLSRMAVYKVSAYLHICNACIVYVGHRMTTRSGHLGIARSMPTW